MERSIYIINLFIYIQPPLLQLQQELGKKEDASLILSHEIGKI